ncbi:MAG: hypothetical protein JO303_03640 [Caulobacteraceae bacterium]|nr:hypothetical protein [Caulobacteraceae bacterium]
MAAAVFLAVVGCCGPATCAPVSPPSAVLSCDYHDWRGGHSALWRVSADGLSEWNVQTLRWDAICPKQTAAERNTCATRNGVFSVEEAAFDPGAQSAGYVLSIDLDLATGRLSERGLDVADAGMSYGFGVCRPASDPANGG